VVVDYALANSSEQATATLVAAKASRDDPIAWALARSIVAYPVTFSIPEAAASYDNPFLLLQLVCHSDPGYGSDGVSEFTLNSPQPHGGFHFLQAGCCYSIIVNSAAASHVTREGDLTRDVQIGDIVKVDKGCLGRVSGQPSGGKIPVEVTMNDRATSRWVAQPCKRVCQGGAVFVFNTQTLPDLRNAGLPERISRCVVMPWDELGHWLLGLPGNYAYTASLDKRFVVALLEHGLFVLPGDDQLFACPFPVTPFIFRLQEAPDGGTWCRCKMLRRYGQQFELSCNSNFEEHLKRCGAYHTACGGTWISERLISLLAEIGLDQANAVRVYAFELWDKMTGELAAASFGLAIGAFFHDFSMCCLVRDRRSAGSILSKAVGALLTDCGVLMWYWGCKVPYMAEYERHGAKEVPREEYYNGLREALGQKLRLDPCEAISSGKALIPCRSGVHPVSQGSPPPSGRESPCLTCCSV